MDQNGWFNPSSPAPQTERQAFEAGWSAAQKQMAFSQPMISERIFQQQQSSPPPRPTYLPGRVVHTPDEVRASEIPMDGTVAVFPSSDYSYVVLKAWNSNGSIQTEYYKHMNPNEQPKEDTKFEEFKMGLNERLERIEKMLMSTQDTKKVKEVTTNEQPRSSTGSNGNESYCFGSSDAE